MLAQNAAQRALQRLALSESADVRRDVISAVAHGLAQDETGECREWMVYLGRVSSGQLTAAERARRQRYQEALSSALAPLQMIQDDPDALRRYVAVIAAGGQPLAAIA